MFTPETEQVRVRWDATAASTRVQPQAGRPWRIVVDPKAYLALSQTADQTIVKLDADADPYSLALQCEDGKVYLLLKDPGSRMFFKDAKLLNRPMRLTGRLVANGALSQVVNVHSYVGGKVHEAYYWCDICIIRGYEAGICDCCGGPMEFREAPVK